MTEKQSNSINSEEQLQQFNFEQSLQKLNTIVENLEKGNLTLEESLTQFEQGVQLTRQCQTILKNAEQRVNTLTQQPQQEEQHQPTSKNEHE